MGLPIRAFAAFGLRKLRFLLEAELAWQKSVACLAPLHYAIAMAEQSNNQMAEERTDLAEDRTDWAEDRTLMANERTFAGWMRTGLASVGIGLGFNALFGKLDPIWLPKAIATLFIMIGIFIFWVAERKGCSVQSRLEAHKSEPIERMSMKLVAGAMGLGSAALAVSIWILNFE